MSSYKDCPVLVWLELAMMTYRTLKKSGVLRSIGTVMDPGQGFDDLILKGVILCGFGIPCQVFEEIDTG